MEKDKMLPNKLIRPIKIVEESKADDAVLVDAIGRIVGMVKKECAEKIVKSFNDYDEIADCLKRQSNKYLELQALNREYIGLLTEVARLNVECCNWVYNPSLSERIDKAIEKAEKVSK